MENITYDVRIWKTETYKGNRVTTYKVRWKTGSKPWKRPFQTKAQASSFEAELRSAASRGEAFDITAARGLIQHAATLIAINAPMDATFSATRICDIVSFPPGPVRRPRSLGRM